MNEALNQIFVILFIYVSGYAIAREFVGDERKALRIVSAFPSGLALFSIIGLCILISNIKYNVISVSIIYSVILLFYLFVKIRKNRNVFLKQTDLKGGIVIFAVILIMAVVCVSGIISVGISNDSVYFYSLYPQTIVIDQGYNLSYDVFLTDVGQSVAVINTLPFLFGFHESAGIQTAMMISFICFFVYILRERISDKIKTNKNKKMVINAFSVLVFLLIVTCTPFLVLSRWILANAYYMEYMFIVFGLTNFACKAGQKKYYYLIMIMMCFLSMARMEGALFSGLLTLCISSLEIDNKDLLKYYIIPSVVLIIPYYSVLYLKLGVNPLYSFLDIKKAILQVLFIAVIGLYIVFIRNKRLTFLQGNRFYPTIFGILLLFNIVLLVYDHSKYVANLISYMNNIFRGNGWGFFGFFVLLFVILLPQNKKMSVNVFFCISFVMLCLVILFARDGALRVGTGDSGNRVLLQIVPFALYSIIDEILGVIFDEK